MAECHGNTVDHCCHMDDRPCPHLVENAGERRWACGLMLELGTWSLVHVDPRYLTDVRPVFARVGISDCGDYPAEGEHCTRCGVGSRG